MKRRYALTRQFYSPMPLKPCRAESARASWEIAKDATLLLLELGVPLCFPSGVSKLLPIIPKSTPITCIYTHGERGNQVKLTIWEPYYIHETVPGPPFEPPAAPTKSWHHHSSKFV